LENASVASSNSSSAAISDIASRDESSGLAERRGLTPLSISIPPESTTSSVPSSNASCSSRSTPCSTPASSATNKSFEFYGVHGGQFDFMINNIFSVSGFTFPTTLSFGFLEQE